MSKEIIKWNGCTIWRCRSGYRLGLVRCVLIQNEDYLGLILDMCFLGEAAEIKNRSQPRSLEARHLCFLRCDFTGNVRISSRRLSYI
jgi:hypothetical protein